jgi:hypothetical protein
MRACVRGAGAVLPRRDPIRLADGRSGRKHHRPGLLCARLAPLAALDEDERGLRRIEGLAVDRERRPPREHDVQLLVVARATAGLIVAGHDGLPRLAEIGAEPERAQPERCAERQPPPAGVRGTGLELVEVEPLHVMRSARHRRVPHRWRSRPREA